MKDSKKQLIENFFYDISEGQVVGMVEPPFSENAEQIAEFFGTDIKIIFLVRNPVDAEFSRFKMSARDGYLSEDVYANMGVEGNVR